jgi:hypothetical protein
MSIEPNNYHDLIDKWTLWAHLPDDTNWDIKSYKNIYTCKYVEDTITLMETLPDILVKNCMLFFMRGGIFPTWEDKNNRFGGCFSYKISNKNVYQVWRDISYLLVGESLSNNNTFVSTITGITVSPKKNFCILKIWTRTCDFQNSTIITNEIKNLPLHGCLFKKHMPEY